MDHEKLLKKDWQLLNAYSSISIMAELRTIMDNQAYIISKLTGLKHKDVLAQMDKHKDENYKQVRKEVMRDIPDYPDYTPRVVEYQEQ